MGKEKLELILPLNVIPAEVAWDRIWDLFGRPREALFTNFGKRKTIKAIRAESARKGYFLVEEPNCYFLFSQITSAEHCLVQVCLDSVEQDTEWDGWVLAFSDGLISGRLYDVEYDHWQTAERPFQFEVMGRPHEHLPRVPNGLPPPLDEMIIDTSQNPGRRVICDGYVEAVGATMWLTSLFFERSGADEEAVKSCSWCRCKQLSPDVMRLQVMPTCFTSREGKEGQLQNRLRRLLFPSSVASKSAQAKIDR